MSEKLELNVPPITQSLIKSVYDYVEGNECGNVIIAKYFEHIEFPPSDVQRLGMFMEWMMTKQKTKYGHVPEPIRLKPKKLTKKEVESGMKQEDVKGELSKKFADILEHIPYFEKMMQEYGLEIVSTGKTIEGKIDGVTIKGDVDIEARYTSGDKKGQIVYVDLKSSGLLYNKWEDFGWHEDSLHTKDKLLIQAVHYKYIGEQLLGYEPDFIFMLFSNTNTIDRETFKIVLDDNRFEQHEKTVKQVNELLNTEGFLQPKPNATKCLKCYLKELGVCKSAIEIPEIKTIGY